MQTLRVLVSLLIVAVAILVYALWGRAGRERNAALPPKAPVIPVSRLTEVRPIKDIDLDYHSPDLPPGPGQPVFATQCVICHSPRYILNQPAFPRKTWTAEVHKMVKGYGAPIDPDQEKQIVNYLVVWHGKEDAPSPRGSRSKMYR
jgi:sulfite dehydrogenase (cytochrome) subunit B